MRNALLLLLCLGIATSCSAREITIALIAPTHYLNAEDCITPAEPLQDLAWVEVQTRQPDSSWVVYASLDANPGDTLRFVWTEPGGFGVQQFRALPYTTAGNTIEGCEISVWEYIYDSRIPGNVTWPEE
jgi:hypothetical protein